MSYKIFSELQTVFIICNGYITLLDVKKILNDLSSDHTFSTKFNILADVSDCDTNISPNDVHEYINYITHGLKVIDSRKTAFLTSKPVHVVLSTLFSDLMIETPVTANVYSTLDAALSYISIDRKSFNYLKIQYNEFKNKMSQLPHFTTNLTTHSH